MDHITGFDELRRFTIPVDAVIPVYGSDATLSDLERMFAFAFNGQNRYPGYLKPESHRFHGPFALGQTKVTPLPVRHGKVETHGFLFESQRGTRLVYMPDVKEVPPEAIDLMRDVDTLIIDALRFREHPTHLNFEGAIAVGNETRAKRTYLTHFTCDVRHAEAEKALPRDVFLAYDGLKIAV
jgi:phosphoribosyl 1,2-cyclic phosphate phosphodiesterase